MKLSRSFQLIIAFFILLSLGCSPQKNVSSSVQPAAVTVKDTTRLDTGNQIIERPVYRASRTILNDLVHTKLEITPDWKDRWVNGIATLTLSPHFYPQDELILDAKSFDIHSVKLLKGKEEKDLTFDYDGNHLDIHLDTVYTRDQQYQVKIDYTARPLDRQIHESEAIESDQGFYFINPDGKDPDQPREIWTQGETESNSCWFPTIDAPDIRCTEEMYVTIDDKYVTLSNGLLVYSKNNGDGTRTDYWKLDMPIAPYLFVLVAGDFSIIKDQWKDVPLYYYVEPAFAPYAKEIFGRTPEMISFFSDILNYKFPWPKYAQVIVRDFVTGAMEDATASVFYEDLLKNGHELVDENDDNTIAHELFHHWFGDLVTCESWANLPLNESFANYAEYLWNEHKYGAYEADFHALDERDQYFAEAQDKQVDLIRYNYKNADDMFDSHSYSKGGLILHMLRKYVGDDAFFTALHDYLEEYKFSSVEIHNLRLVFEKVTGEDLNWFFNEWFLASGYPDLKVRDNYDSGFVTVTVQQLQDLQTTPLYKLPLYIDVWSAGKKYRFHVVVDKSYQQFQFKVPAEPDLVLFDGEQQLLAKIDHPLSISQYIYQYYHTDKFYPRYQSLDTLSTLLNDNKARQVVFDALSDHFWYFRQMAVDAFENYAGNDSARVMNKANDLALHDPDSKVRADALNTLYSIGGGQFENTYKQELNDTSYAVTGSALYIELQTDPGNAPGLVKRFETNNSLYIAIPLASYFIDAGSPNRYEWFVQRIHHMRWEGLYYMLQYFGQYLMKSPEMEQRRGIAVLEKFARYHNSEYVRMAAYQALGLLTDLSGVKALREDIRKNEKNDYLKRLYQNYPN